MTMRSDAAELAKIALAAAQKAGALAASGFRRPKRVDHKGATDLVTEFDLRCEELIRDFLAEHAPGIPVVGEEHGGAIGGDITFFVDPIDGTMNYAHGHPFWSVSVGAAARAPATPPTGSAADAAPHPGAQARLAHAGLAHAAAQPKLRPIAGAVVAPALGLAWTGAAGVSSQRNGEACTVSATERLDQALLATGFPHDRSTNAENNFAQFVVFKKRAQGVRRCGSAAIDLCFVADGTYDGYWELRLSPWDAAAGLCILGSAGGKVTDVRGDACDVTNGQFVASNGKVHDEMLRVLAEAALLPPL